MRNYLNNVKERPPHERRIHAMQLSASIVAVLFMFWIATLGVRLATSSPAQAGDGSQGAAVVQSQTGNATLYVASTTTQ